MLRLFACFWVFFGGGSQLFTIGGENTYCVKYKKETQRLHGSVIDMYQYIITQKMKTGLVTLPYEKQGTTQFHIFIHGTSSLIKKFANANLRI